MELQLSGLRSRPTHTSTVKVTESTDDTRRPGPGSLASAEMGTLCASQDREKVCACVRESQEESEEETQERGQVVLEIQRGL